MALNPRRSLTQYTRTVWTQEHGLPQDTIRTIAQTADGYLWLGTDEGLARFDGYEFVVFSKNKGDLPSNSITALAAGKDGSLWIGTADGLTRYDGSHFTTFTTKDGLPDNGITALSQDHTGALWIVAGIFLSRFDQGKFTNFRPGADLPIEALRAVYEDRKHRLWIAGFGGVARSEGGKFVQVLGASTMDGDIVASMLQDREGNLWIAGSEGLMRLAPGGGVRRYDARDGLPDPFVRSLWEDRDGNLWAGTNGGLCRLENGRFVAPEWESSRDRDWVRCIYEDREGDLWVGMNSGLNRFRDDIFSIYSRNEGLPSDEPTTVFQDHSGRVWIGFHDSGLMLFDKTAPRIYTERDGLPGREIFSIRETRRGDLLVATRGGLARVHGGRFTNYAPHDPLARHIVFDALEDASGNIWMATPGALEELRGGVVRTVISGGSLLNSAFVVLGECRDGGIWAGTYGKGLWHVKDGRRRLYTTADGLGGDQIRSLHEDAEGTLWIGTFGGGLDAFRDGRFVAYTSRQGLLSDNISHVEDDGHGCLWLSTTRGICRVSKQQLRDLKAGRIEKLSPTDYGVGDGLRSAQCAPGYPTSGGGCRTTDGRLWFPTSRGLAVLEPDARRRQVQAPVVHLLEVVVDGRSIDLSRPALLPPGEGRVQVRYTGIHLNAPGSVVYSYKLEGLDTAWVQAGTRRIINYNSLGQGEYRFLVRAEVDGGLSGEASYSLRLLPHFYETLWFRVLCGAMLVLAIWAILRWRVRQIRGGFALALEERARLAREIHDTLAQGFVGISSQLDAVEMSMPEDADPARQYLDMAQKMARHSLTEARRSVMDLRASALEGQGLAAALRTGARQWTMGFRIRVQFDIDGQLEALPEPVEQNLLRIAQEAVTNVIKHAHAQSIRIGLSTESRRLILRVADDGAGFEQQEAFSAAGGHFGILGMRERAERIGGELELRSSAGQGTQVEVTVPLR